MLPTSILNLNWLTSKHLSYPRVCSFFNPIKAADQGHPAALRELSNLYLTGALGVLQDDDLAFVYCLKVPRKKSSIGAKPNLSKIRGHKNDEKFAESKVELEDTQKPLSGCS